jgi:hypothetical protein
MEALKMQKINKEMEYLDLRNRLMEEQIVGQRLCNEKLSLELSMLRSQYSVPYTTAATNTMPSYYSV